MSFDGLIGNHEIKEKLVNILENNQISHSYMFIGNRGIGKKKFAKEFTKGILCLDENKKICNNCKSCIEFDNNNNPEYYEIGLNDENSIKIDTIREMQKKVQELPIVSKRKVYIIDDSECMTKDAQNCLLKTLEEPPEFVTIILIVSNENLILNTIKSRCLKIYFNNINENEIKKYINDNLNISDFSNEMLTASCGSIGNAIRIYEDKELYSEIGKIFNNIEKYHVTDVISKLDLLYKNKDKIFELLEYINTIFISKAKEDCKYVNYIEYVEKTKKSLKQNCNYDMCIDKLIFNIWDK